MRPSGCEGGGGTIIMQVVRGYLLTPEQTISRKIKEIFLALELESNISKEEIFELYVNRVFLGIGHMELRQLLIHISIKV